MKRGIFITMEGGDGSGKSTQIELLRQYFEEKGIEYIITREPGGTPISEKIRGIILDKNNSDMDPMTEALLHAASRAQHVNQLIGPAIERGKMVISDRFVDSSIAYQGYGRNLGEVVGVINSYAIGQYMPDVTFLFELSVEEGLNRLTGSKDRLESERLAFHQAVHDGYQKIKEKYPDRVIPIDAGRSIEKIRIDIRDHIERILENINDI